MSPEQRLARSETVASGWEQMGPTGRLADSIRMCREEMLILEAIGAEHPAMRDRARALIARYQRLVLRLKLVN